MRFLVSNALSSIPLWEVTLLIELLKDSPGSVAPKPLDGSCILKPTILQASRRERLAILVLMEAEPTAVVSDGLAKLGGYYYEDPICSKLSC